MKTPQTMSNRIAVILLLAFFITSCTFTTTRTKPPEFKLSVDSIEGKIDSLVTCEHITLNGAEKITNGKSSSEMEIDIINGKNMPSDDDRLKTLGKLIVSRLRTELKNPNDYNTYKVLFVALQTKGNVTTRNYRGWIYKSEEL